MREKETGLEVAYLFWEASVNRNLEAPLPPPSPPGAEHPQISTVSETECFDPLSCDVYPENSVVLSVDTITTYLETALAVLGLHTEARTSFITYWLPSFLKHTYIALRFVSQASYELAAPLEITPAPEAVRRVYMLFKGVPGDDLGPTWDESMNRAQEDVRFWRDVVGVEDRTAGEVPRLEVLEWGGMEIASS
ncbi:hypothetical protein PQX77_021025 [Marasmius sp. AFHP31]|nr:hypothetical protein PQX77_021025 [Marasmius sp. AFHP31]